MKRYRSSSIMLAIGVGLLSTSCGDSDPTEVDTDPGPQWQTVFSDDFNRSNGPIGSSYAVLIYDPINKVMGFDVSISNNRVQISGPAFSAVTYANPVTSDPVRVSAKFSPSAEPSDNFGFAVSARGTALNAPPYTVTGAYGGGLEASTMGIWKISGGGSGEPVDLVSKPYSLQQGRWYSLELTVAGAVLMLVVKDVASGATDTVTVTDAASPLTGTTVGMNGCFEAWDIVVFDDFLIEELR